ncbi:3395_t:CDS:2, partial [Entrophospora sp. SA101]
TNNNGNTEDLDHGSQTSFNTAREILKGKLLPHETNWYTMIDIKDGSDEAVQFINMG